jgi:broad specificity phosphatase PhoE
MKRVMLVRHAEPRIEADIPAEDWALTSRGIAAANRLASELARLGPTIILASPERKAVETANILSAVLGLPIEQEERFSEHGAGPGEFLADYAEFRDLVKRHFDHSDDVVMRQESSRDAGARFAEALASWLTTPPTDVPVTVSHGRIMSSWLGGLTETSAWDIWTNLRMPDLIEVDLDRKTFRTIDFPLF